MQVLSSPIERHLCAPPSSSTKTRPTKSGVFVCGVEVSLDEQGGVETGEKYYIVEDASKR